VICPQQRTGDRQTQTGAALAATGGEERFEDPLDIAVSHSRPVVSHQQANVIGLDTSGDADLARAHLTAVLQQDSQGHLEAGLGQGDLRQICRQIDSDRQTALQAVSDADRHGLKFHRRPRLGPRHVGARQVQQPRHQIGQAPRIGIDVAEEATTLLRFHVVAVVLQEFDSALDTRQRRLELMADGGGEVAQITGTAIHGLGHPAEVLIKVADLDRGCRGRRRHLPPAVGDVAGDPTQGLDGACDAA